MTLLIDATTAQHARGGIGVVTDGLIGALSQRRSDPVFLLSGPHTNPQGLAAWSPPLVSRTAARIAFQRLALPAVVGAGSRWLGRPDRVLHLDSYVPEWGWPRSHAQVETFVHDVLPLTHPEYFGARKDIAKRRAFAAIRRRQPRVFTSCAFTAGEIERELGIVPEVAEFGCGQFSDRDADALLDEPRAEPGDYILYIGAIEPRKDLSTLLEGFLQAAVEGLRLVIAGNMETPAARAFAAEARLRGGDRIEFAGRASAAEAFALLRHARAVVYPSLAEGFGLPVLEGMAASTPVITTNIPAIASWALDGPLYFEAGEPASLAEAIHAVVLGGAEGHVRRGRELSEHYRWSRFAETLLGS